MANAKRPSSVYVGVRSVPIRANPDPRDDSGEACYATYCADAIDVATGMTATMEGAYLLHECIHAVFDEYGVKSLLLSQDVDEEAVNTPTALGLFLMFRDNPALLEWMAGMCEAARDELAGNHHAAEGAGVDVPGSDKNVNQVGIHYKQPAD